MARCKGRTAESTGLFAGSQIEEREAAVRIDAFKGTSEGKFVVNALFVL